MHYDIKAIVQVNLDSSGYPRLGLHRLGSTVVNPRTQRKMAFKAFGGLCIYQEDLFLGVSHHARTWKVDGISRVQRGEPHNDVFLRTRCRQEPGCQEVPRNCREEALGRGITLSHDFARAYGPNLRCHRHLVSCDPKESPKSQHQSDQAPQTWISESIFVHLLFL